MERNEIEFSCVDCGVDCILLSDKSESVNRALKVIADSLLTERAASQLWLRPSFLLEQMWNCCESGALASPDS